MNGIGHNSATMGSGWIAISRDMRDHPVVGFGQPVKPADPKRGSFSRAEAWIDLVMTAQWQSAKVNNNGKIVLLERAQLLGARAWLAAKWNWGEQVVRTFLDRLEREVMIRRESNQSSIKPARHFANVLTICNYDIFQTASELLGMLDTRPPTNHQPIVNQSPTIHQPESNKGTIKQEDRSPNGDSSPIQLTLDASDHLPASGIRFDESGLPIVMNGKRQALEKILGGKADVDAALRAVAGELDRSGDVWTNIVTAVATYGADAGKPEPKPKRARKLVPEEYSDNFEEFWKVYPRREGKAAASKAWERLSLAQKRRAYTALKSQLSTLLARLRDTRGNFCPLPATWINQGRFDDDAVSPGTAASKHTRNYGAVR